MRILKWSRLPGVLVVFLSLAQVSVRADAVNTEHWTQVECHHFGLMKSLFRSQGLTNDRNGTFWFSSRSSLLKTHSKWASADRFHLFPIPAELSKLGDNHIGDIDYAEGKIYAPIEDGSAYQHPFIGVYDANTLSFKKSFLLPQDQQVDGVPWVAVDALQGRLYASQYSGTTQINIYDLTTLAPIGEVPMKQKIDSLQGAKVHGDFLYITANAPEKGRFAIYRLGLLTGDVIQVGEFASDLTEVEGLTFVPGGKQDQLYALGVTGSGVGRRTELCVFTQDE